MWSGLIERNRKIQIHRVISLGSIITLFVLEFETPSS